MSTKLTLFQELAFQAFNEGLLSVEKLELLIGDNNNTIPVQGPFRSSVVPVTEPKKTWAEISYEDDQDDSKSSALASSAPASLSIDASLNNRSKVHFDDEKYLKSPLWDLIDSKTWKIILKLCKINDSNLGFSRDVAEKFIDVVHSLSTYMKSEMDYTPETSFIKDRLVSFCDSNNYTERPIVYSLFWEYKYKAITILFSIIFDIPFSKFASDIISVKAKSKDLVLVNPDGDTRLYVLVQSTNLKSVSLHFRHVVSSQIAMYKAILTMFDMNTHISDVDETLGHFYMTKDFSRGNFDKNFITFQKKYSCRYDSNKNYDSLFDSQLNFFKRTKNSLSYLPKVTINDVRSLILDLASHDVFVNFETNKGRWALGKVQF